MSAMSIKEEIDNIVTSLWQGKGADINQLSSLIQESVNMILESVSKLKEQGIDFPVEYVSTAVTNYSAAVSAKDDYLLADNLCYEWIEILTVYDELMMSIGA